MIQQLGEDIWVGEKPLSLLKIQFGNRMTVIRAGDQLLLHSPVQIDDTVYNEVAKLGSVRYIVVPNAMHCLFVDQWKHAFPGAMVLAPPGVSKPKPDAELGNDVFREWADVLDHRLIEGMPRLNEFAFLHVPSKTLVLTDLAFNVGGDMPRWSEVFFRLYGAYEHFGPTRLIRALVKDKTAFNASITAILDWDFERIIVSHGGIVAQHGKARFRQAFGV